jgi:hypothetical protein
MWSWKKKWSVGWSPTYCQSFLHTDLPIIWIENQQVGAIIGEEITLQCEIDAYPKSENYWMCNDTIITKGNFNQTHHHFKKNIY